MMKPCFSPWLYLGELSLVVALLAFAYLLQWSTGMMPCALCEIQRVVFAFLGFFFLMAIIFRQRWAQILINGLASLTAVVGILLAARQVWLEFWPPPPGSMSCDASLYYLLQIMPFYEVLTTVFVGGPECAKVTWQFLRLSIPEWSLLWFVVFLLLSGWQFLTWLFLKKK